MKHIPNISPQQGCPNFCKQWVKWPEIHTCVCVWLEWVFNL